MRRKLILQNGEEYYGTGFGDLSDKLVFCGEGKEPDFFQRAALLPALSRRDTPAEGLGALILRCGGLSEGTVEQELKDRQVAGLLGVDIARLSRSAENGGCLGLLTDEGTALEAGLEAIQRAALPKDAVARVSCKEPWVAQGRRQGPHVVAIDCGMKQETVRWLNRQGCKVTVVPWNTTAAEIRRLYPDGVLLSNGPGDPMDVQTVARTVRRLRGKYPMLGLCLGHQLLSLAYGARTYKLQACHRGGSQPVRELSSGKIELTAQNHAYAVDEDSLGGTALEVTHLNLLDGTVEGVCCREERTLGVQYQLGAAEGAALCQRFVSMMEEQAFSA